MATSPPLTWKLIDDLLSSSLESVAPSIVCRVEHKGSVVYEGSFGYTDPDTKLWPVTSETFFDFASVTKIFTMTAVLRLIQANKINSIDTKVISLLPDYDGVKKIGRCEHPISKDIIEPKSEYSNLEISTSQITIKHLLTHSSGLPAWRYIFRDAGGVPDELCDASEIAYRQQKVMDLVKSYDLFYPPGTDLIYSDIGLILLGYALNNHTTSSLVSQVIQQQVIDPLNIQACYNPLATKDQEFRKNIAPTELCVWRNRRCWGEVHDENTASMGGISSHAGLFGTAKDLCKLLSMYLYPKEEFLNKELVNMSTKEHVKGEDGTRRGIGWVLKGSKPVAMAPCGEILSSDTFGHTGFTGTSIWCDPQLELTICLLTNRVYYGRQIEPVRNLRIQLCELIPKIIKESL